MDGITANALEESIQHWERLSTHTNSEYEDISSDHCALCSLFLDKGCNGCPVAQRTGRRGCKGSPWEKVAEVYYSVTPHNTTKFTLHAKEELDFLISLREKEPNVPKTLGD